ncbi:hypothetical protein CDAR_182621 [Caerostris darwini]|uniref:Uncharacterized protein n=1 Tax=Caerostris darwini TaxID=1538125 RepID=A0AAV4SLC0_9ARAC|nr:hypothetical protein CDAR_182621 [Caerostris darwini]
MIPDEDWLISRGKMEALGHSSSPIIIRGREVLGILLRRIFQGSAIESYGQSSKVLQLNLTENLPRLCNRILRKIFQGSAIESYGESSKALQLNLTENLPRLSN